MAPPFVAVGKTGFFDQKDGWTQVLRSGQPVALVPTGDLVEYGRQLS